MGFPGGSAVQSMPITQEMQAGDSGSIPGSGRSPGEGNGNPFHYSCKGNPTDRVAWQSYSPWGCKRVGHNLVAEQQISYKYMPNFCLEF